MKKQLDDCLTLLNSSLHYVDLADRTHKESIINFRGNNIAKGRDKAKESKELLTKAKLKLHEAKKVIDVLEIDKDIVFQDYYNNLKEIYREIKDKINEVRKYVKGDTLENLKKNITEEQRRTLARDSLAWFYRQINRNRNQYDKDAFKPIKIPFAGTLIHFVYDAKWKKVLPIWDRFPLLIMLRMDGVYFYGLNIHYLRLDERVVLLGLLKQHKGSNWQAALPILLESERAKLIADCFRIYLFSQVRSSFVQIDEKYWNNVSFLPTAHWVSRDNE